MRGQGSAHLDAVVGQIGLQSLGAVGLACALVGRFNPESGVKNGYFSL